MTRSILTLSFTCLALLAISPVATASDPPESIESYIQRGEYRALYDHSADLPSGIAFYVTAGTVSALNRKTGREDTIRFVAGSTGLDTDHATLVLDSMLATYEEMSAPSKQLDRSEFCDGEIPRVYGNDALTALAASDDSRNAYHGSTYQQFLSDLSADVAAKVDAWISKSKAYILHVDLDYKKIYARKNIDVNVQIAEICAFQPPSDK